MEIGGLEFVTGDELIGVSTSGLFAPGDVSLADGVITIGTSTGDLIFFPAGSQGRIELVPVTSCPGPNVANITANTFHPTLADAIANAIDGDTLERAPCTLNERGLQLNNRNLTIRGKGPGQTVIDAQGMGRIFEITSPSTVTIEGVTLRNGYVQQDPGGAAIRTLGSGVSLHVRDVHFENNNAEGFPFGAVGLDSGTARFERCVFTGNTTTVGFLASTIGAFGNADLTVVNTLFADNGAELYQVYLENAGGETNGRFINCTFAPWSGTNHIGLADAGISAEVINTVFDLSALAVEIDAGSIFTATRSVFAGAFEFQLDSPSSNAPSCDVNADGVIDFFDISDFLNDFEACTSSG